MDSTSDTTTTDPAPEEAGPPGGPPALGLAPEVTLTRLPFGGAVLVHGVSLALAEWSEREALALDRLLGLDAGGWSTAAADERRTVQELTAAGWLTYRRTDTGGTGGNGPRPADDRTGRRTGTRADGPTAATNAAQGE